MVEVAVAARSLPPQPEGRDQGVQVVVTAGREEDGRREVHEVDLDVVRRCVDRTTRPALATPGVDFAAGPCEALQTESLDSAIVLDSALSLDDGLRGQCASTVRAVRDQRRTVRCVDVERTVSAVTAGSAKRHFVSPPLWTRAVVRAIGALTRPRELGERRPEYAAYVCSVSRRRERRASCRWA